ncbi:MAG: dihydrolipoamide acetyltransferase family protein [Isosphaeraceae bacterium]
MAIEITIPRLGWNMDEGVFVGWLKQDGELIKAGEPIFSLETDKAVQEIESLDSGRLQIAPDGPQPGQTVAVGTVIGTLLQEGETAREPAVVASKLAPAAAAAAVAAPVAVATSSPRARRKARELGIDWTTIAGTGRTGRVRERDVLAAAAKGGSTPPPSSPAVSAAAGGDFEVLPIDATRRTIAERMMQGAHGTAPVTLTTSVDATNLVNLRQQFKAVTAEQGGPDARSVGYLEIVVKLTAIALERHPILGARWDGDRILIHRNVHIGIAVDTDVGLLVPVIRDVPRMTLREVAARAQDLAARARNRGLKVEELQGGTFTITNLGAYDIETFTPIINVPQCAVLGMGRIVRQPSALERHVVLRDRLTLSLTFDHRIVDGAPAARFLQTLRGLIENPSPWLLP